MGRSLKPASQFQDFGQSWWDYWPGECSLEQLDAVMGRGPTKGWFSPDRSRRQDMELKKDPVLMISSESTGPSHHQPAPKLSSYMCQCILSFALVCSGPITQSTLTNVVVVLFNKSLSTPQHQWKSGNYFVNIDYCMRYISTLLNTVKKYYFFIFSVLTWNF